MRRTFLIVVLLGWAAAAGAQQSAMSDLYFTTPLTITGGRDFGIPVGNTRVHDHTVLLSAPMLSMLKVDPRTEFMLGYQPQFEWFNRHKELNSWNHDARFNLRHELTPRWLIDFRDSFHSSKDYTRRLDNTLLLPRGRYNENVFSFTAAYDLTSTTNLRFRFDNTWVDYKAMGAGKPLFFSRIGNSYNATLERRLDARSKVTANYSYFTSHSLEKFDPDGVEILPSEPTHYVGGGYEFRPTSSWTLEFNAGGVWNSGASYLLSALAEKQFQRFTIIGGYSRYLSFFGGPGIGDVVPGRGLGRGLGRDLTDTAARGFDGNAITETATIVLRGNLTRRWGMEFRALGSRSLTGDAARDLKSAVGGIRVDYKLGEHVVVFTAAEFMTQKANAIYNQPVRRARYLGGLEFIIGDGPEALARRLDALSTPRRPAKPEEKGGEPAGMSRENTVRREENR